MTDEQIAEIILAEKMKDPMWRLTCGLLYKIAPADGKGLIDYKPRPEHVEIFEALITKQVKQLVLLKARRPGFSTAIGLFMLDMAIFNPGMQCSLVDQNAADATRKLDRIICVALDNMPEWIKRRIKVGAECGLGAARNGEHLSLQLDDSNRSDIYAGMNSRGGSNDFLWCSELAVIQFEDAPRSAKIRAGAFPSARHGIIVIESTWAGGKHGDVWDLIEPTLKGVSDDVTLIFCPWWRDPRNVHETAKMDDVGLKYFAKMDPLLESEYGVVLSDYQKRWWNREKRMQGAFMARENPSTLSECWEAPVDGSIYGASIDRARAEGRVCLLPIQGSVLTHTAWDLGAPRQTRVIYFQIDGPWINIVDIDPVTDETLVQRIARMRDKKYHYGSHYFPHDAKQTKTSGHTLATEFAAAWLKTDPELVGNWDAVGGRLDFSNDYRKVGIRFVPRTTDVWLDINHGLQLFPSLRFASPACDAGLEILSLYRMPAVKMGGVENGTPVHDFTSHLADAFRSMFSAHHARLIEMGQPQFGQQNNPWAEEDGHGGPRILSGPRWGPATTQKRR